MGLGDQRGVQRDLQSFVRAIYVVADLLAYNVWIYAELRDEAGVHKIEFEAVGAFRVARSCCDFE